jgi:transposase
VKKERKKYEKEFKLDALRLYEESKKTAREIELDLGISNGSIAQWKREFEKNKDNSFTGNGNPRDIEFYKMKKELEIVKQERDILKKALGIFSKT